MMEAVFFYTFSAVMLAAACAVVCSRRPIYSVLSLLLAMFCLAAMFVMLGAYFVAALQILLYAGAVLVLFLFVIMLLNLPPAEALPRLRLFTLRTVGTASAAALLLLLVTIIRRSAESLPGGGPAVNGTVESIGRLLFSTYLIPFELASFVILAAIVGAVTLAKQQPPRP